MFNRQIEITRENESILFINSVIENLRYGLISLDTMFNYLVKEKANGRLLTADGIEFICKANNYDAEAIGKYFLELLPQIKAKK